MSHFFTLVLLDELPASRKEVEAAVGELLAPYNEEVPHPPHSVPCWCVGSQARNEVRDLQEKQFGSIEGVRDTYWSDPRSNSDEADSFWRELTRERNQFYESRLAEHPLRDTPDKDCDECDGTGSYLTTENPQGYWDWWSIGGRWTGRLSGYDPETDPTNSEVCFICAGTGRRDDAIGNQARLADPAYKCNGCDGSGVAVKWPTSWADHDGDIVPALAVDIEKVGTPYALVTSDGVWHAKGEMGWFALERSRKMTDDEWLVRCKELLGAAKPGSVAVVVDCHV
jgi:hypothetical protein